MARSRSAAYVIIIFVCAVLGAAAGAYYRVLPILDKPQEFRSLAKVVAGRGLGLEKEAHDNSDLYGTLIELLRTEEMSRRAVERIRALHPDLAEHPVRVAASRSEGTGIINVMVTGSEPRYTRIFLDALLDELVAARQFMREQSMGKVVQIFLQEVVNHQKRMEEMQEALELARAKTEILPVKTEHERLVGRLAAFRNQRDDLRLELKALAAVEPSRAALEARLALAEQEIATLEAATQAYEPAAAAFRIASENYANAKLAYEKLFEKVPALENSRGLDVAVQERASPAAENVEDWTQSLALGAGGGAVLGGLFGLLLSILILRSPTAEPA